MNYPKSCWLSLALVLSSVAACNSKDPDYQDAGRSEYLSVSPSAKGAEYSAASTDAFLDGAHVIRDASNFKLKVINSAPVGDNRLVLTGDRPSVADDVNS